MIEIQNLNLLECLDSKMQEMEDFLKNNTELPDRDNFLQLLEIAKTNMKTINSVVEENQRILGEIQELQQYLNEIKSRNRPQIS
ncbi:unnamed protein product [Blepharisma stoltei]|uniref:Uncharacterized protein n=1 Tax=Blepharisma stoltei TaxID=1481888 RepID=A0AAU9IWV8_9CILI|nr:unnamed protein product [Blepharisma stoltei]